MHQTEEVKQRVFFFGDGIAECDPKRKDILGGKGSSLAAMCSAKLPVPPGFTISIDCCKAYHDNGGMWPEGLEDDVKTYMAKLEKSTGRKFGEGKDPLLVSVRSGARASRRAQRATRNALTPAIAPPYPQETAANRL